MELSEQSILVFLTFSCLTMALLNFIIQSTLIFDKLNKSFVVCNSRKNLRKILQNVISECIKIINLDKSIF
jgi:hypothetical protein